MNLRTLWVLLVAWAATTLFGSLVLVCSLLRVRGNVYGWATREWARNILWASGVEVVLHGTQHLPEGEPQVLVSNHLSIFDILAQAATLPLPFHFVGKKELNRVPFFGRAWRAAGHISLDRSNRADAIRSLRAAGQRIQQTRGKVVIYPEGTRSRTGKLQPFKKGAFMLAIEAKVPVVPTVVRGSFAILQPDTLRLRPSTIHLHFLEPIPTAHLDANSADALMLRVHERILRELGEAPHSAGSLP